MRSLVLIAALVVSACGLSAAFEPPPLQQQSDRKLCKAFYFASGARAEEIKDEIVKRGLIPQSQWTDVAQGALATGAGECALFAALGEPLSESRTIKRSGTIVTYTYGNLGRRVVTVEDGAITSIIEY